MRLVEPSATLLAVTPMALQVIETTGRVCYKSEDKITTGSAVPFICKILKNGHEAVLEHASATIHFVTDRGITHEIVRHRLASYCQESTRYCDYGGKDMEFIYPDATASVVMMLRNCEELYKDLRAQGVPPQFARDILPTCLKTEIVMTANMREWRHVLRLRLAPAAHPKMRKLMSLALAELQRAGLGILFEDCV